jgi:hypothetical protein
MSFKKGFAAFRDRVSRYLQGDPASRTNRERAIINLEVQLECALPEAYRSFLLANEEYEPFMNTCDVYTDTFHEQLLYSFIIRKYLRVNPDGRDDLYYNYQRLRDKLPRKHLLPIAFDRFRNVMLISLTNGELYFWDMIHKLDEQADQTQLPYERIFYVAEDFTEFQQRLYRQKRFN